MADLWPHVILTLAALVGVLAWWGGPPPPPGQPVSPRDGDLERARLDEYVRRRDAQLAPIREAAADPDADRRTEALAKMADR